MKPFVIFDENAKISNRKLSKQFLETEREAIGVIRKFLEEHSDEISLVEVAMIEGWLATSMSMAVGWFRVKKDGFNESIYK